VHYIRWQARKKRVSTEDIGALARRAGGGDASAMTALGKRMLTGDGIVADPGKALAHIEEAARRDEPEAVALLARFSAWGVMRPRSMTDALDGLARAAALGFEPAQRELRMLAGGLGDDYGRLRRQVDPVSLTRAPGASAASESPSIRIAKGFASAAECRWLVERGRHGMRRAQVYRRDAPGYRDADSRTNSESDYTIWNADIVLALIRERMAASLGTESRYFEVTKLLRYEPGQRFSLHADYQEPSTPALAREIEQRGQRVATFLVYLNEDYDGGETDFPEAGFRFRGSSGDALWFMNVDARGEPDARSVHAGMPPTRGTKWLLSQWVRGRPVG
jgi:prolyl 4-hydroxylase